MDDDEDCDPADPGLWLADDFPSDDLTELDADFCSHYCRRSTSGSVVLHAPSAAMLEDFRCLSSVGGSLYVDGATAPDLAGLSSLESVGGNLSITGSLDLVETTGLDTLTSVGGWMTISSSYLSDDHRHGNR